MESKPADTNDFVASLSSPPTLPDGKAFFTDAPIVVTRAPGRLDVMGGIADYSGSLVLQLPIQNATHVALQRTRSTKLRVLSVGSETRFMEMGLEEFYDREGGPISYEEARLRFSAHHHWASYIAGAFLVLMREKNYQFSEGAHIFIKSSVPEGKGVSSSAAVEVASMQAVNVAFDIGLSPQELARLCQKLENLVAGAPCGIMDQMTSACGEADQLLELLCQPDLLRGTVALPQELELWGIDSGVRHSVGGSDYGTVRTAAFMGYRIIAEIAGLEVTASNRTGKVLITDPKWNGYLANITPNEFEKSFASLLPEHMSGEEFLTRYQGITDVVTAVSPKSEYPVHNATRHPIYEHARVQSFASILKNWTGVERAPLLGELMFESHRSYSDCDLGSEATDLIVNLVRQTTGGLFGARITGGGSGGTVAVLGLADKEIQIQNVKQQFYERTGHQPLIISGSSPGAGVFNHLKLEKRTSANAQIPVL